jgi:putative peptidoglycan lipid II flippase
MLVDRQAGVEAWALGYLVGCAVALAAVFAAAVRAGHRMWFAFSRHHPAVRGLVAAVTPFVALAAVSQLSTAGVRVITSLLPGGVITALNIGLTMTNIPLGLSAYALGTTLVPAFARSLSRDSAEVELLFSRSTRMLTLALSPIVALLFVTAQPVTRILFERGAFDAHATALTSDALRIYAISLIAQPFFVVAHRALLAAAATRLLLLLGVVEAGLLILTTIALSGPFGHVGVAAAYTLTVAIGATLLTTVSRRFFRRSDVAGSIAFAAAAASVAGAAAVVSAVILVAFPEPTDHLLDLGRVLFAWGAGTITYLVVVWFSPLRPEWTDHLMPNTRPGRSSHG